MLSALAATLSVTSNRLRHFTRGRGYSDRPDFGHAQPKGGKGKGGTGSSSAKGKKGKGKKGKGKDKGSTGKPSEEVPSAPRSTLGNFHGHRPGASYVCLRAHWG